MAVFRMVYRKRKVLLMMLFMCLFWVAFLYLSMPPAAGFKKKAVDRDKISLTRKIVVKPPVKDVSVISPDEKTVKKSITTTTTRRPAIQQPPVGPKSNIGGHQALPPPNNIKNSTNIAPKKTPTSTAPKRTLSNGTDHSVIKRGDSVVEKSGHVDSVLQQIKNKTYEVGAHFKNKTLQKLSDLGLIAKPQPIIKQIDKLSLLNFTMSQEELMFVIKTLIKESEMKTLQMKNKTLVLKKEAAKNLLLNLSKPHESHDLCVCSNLDCTCCAQLQLVQFHVSRKACTNFTYVPKSQELSLSFLLDGKDIFNSSISAEHPPKICLGSTVIQICVEFYNMSFTVNMHEEHKTQLNGCLDYSFNVYNRTISTFPLGCFEIPSNKHRDKDQHQIPLLGNWVP